MAMQSTWDNMQLSQKNLICDGWNTPSAQEMLLDSFMSNAPSFDREVARNFFDTHC